MQWTVIVTWIDGNVSYEAVSAASYSDAIETVIDALPGTVRDAVHTIDAALTQ